MPTAILSLVKSSQIKYKVFPLSLIVSNIYLPSGFTSRPTQERTDCIASLYEHLSELNPSKFYLLGDFNLVLSSQDCTGPFRVNTEDKIMLSKLIEDYNLVDIFRFRHPNKTSFTFFCYNAASRLDRICVPDEDLQHVSDTEMTSVSFSDHSKCPVIKTHAHLSAAKRSTYWKLNDSLYDFSSNLACLKTEFSLLLERKSPHEDIVSWGNPSSSPLLSTSNFYPPGKTFYSNLKKQIFSSNLTLFLLLEISPKSCNYAKR